MDSEVVQSRVHENDEHEPHNGGSQEEEHHSDHEKKSVLKRVKAKAKKIKDTIKKHGHHVLDPGRENNNEDQSSPDAHDLDESEKMAEDREVDGAPVDESEDAKSVPPTYEQVENFVKIATPASEQVENLDELGVNSGGTTVMGEEPHHEPRVAGASPTTETNQNIATEPAKTFAEEGKPWHNKGNLERPTGLDENLRTPGSRPEAYTPPNYQTKATDPTGAVDETDADKSAPPTYEQVEDIVKSATPEFEQVENPDKSGVNSGGTTTVMGEEPHHKPPVAGASPTTETNQNIATEPAKTFAEEEKPGHYKGDLERPTGLDEDPRTPGSGPEAYSPPSYQTQVTDPIGTVDETEADKSAPPAYEQVEDFVKSATPEFEQVENLDRSGVNSGGTTTVMGEEPHHEPRVVGASPTTETNQNIATEPAETFAEEGKPGHHKGNLEEPTGLDEDPRIPGSRPEAYTPPSYQTQVTDPTGTGSDEVDITPVGRSFERMSVQDEPKPIPEPKVLQDFAETRYPSDGSQHLFVPKPDPELYSATKTEHPSVESHDQNLPELSSATETQYPSAGINEQPVPEISTVTETQYPSGEGHGQFAPDTISTSTDSYKENPEATGQTFNDTTAAVEEKPSYESVEKPSNQNIYTDKISSATSAIADKAVSAENAADSELGYGEEGDRDNKVTTLEEPKSEDASNKSGSTLGYGKNIADSLTEKLAPVYGKVAGVGSAVKSKVSGTRTGDSAGVETENVGKEQDKGVSVKEYLAEKLKPGEEHKALSEVISEALYKRKEEPKKASGDEDRDVTKVVSDAIQKQEEEPGEKEQGPLGSGHDRSETVSEESNVNSPGKGVVGKIKGVVGSWFGKSEENQSSPVAGGKDPPKNKNTGVEVEQFSQAEGER